MAKKTPKQKSAKDATPPPQDTKGKNKKSNDKNANGNGKSNNVSNSQSQQPERPASTNRPSSGKTPISLLHEHAQRSKWEKVQYDMMKVKDGLVATAILQWKDPKANEMIDVKVRHSLPAKETPIEARYFAATAALHRVCFNKNLQMVLPREFKDTWSQLETERKNVLKESKDKHDRIYTNDPFKVVIEDRKNKEAKSKEREIRLNNEAKVKKQPNVLTSMKVTTPSSKSTKTSSNQKSTNRSDGRIAKPIHRKTVSFPKKVWDNALSFGFTVQQRELIQKIIKSHIQWKKTLNPEASTKQLLLSIGFRQSHVEESLQYQDPLSFLLFNVPEDDLPAYFHDVSASNDSITIADKNESLVRKVMDFGVGRPEAIVSLNENNQSVSSAIISLTSNLLNYKYDGETDPVESQEIWEEEIASLTSIFDPQDIKIIDQETVQMNLNDLLCLKIFKSPAYPNDLAGLIVTTKVENHKIPNYVKNNLVKGLAQYAIENLLGMSYIYSLVDWLKENMAQIIENPGPLLQVKVESTIAEDLQVDDQKNTKQRRSFRSNPDTAYIKNDYEKRTQTSEFKSMVKSRTKLPAWDVQKQLIETVNANQVSLITGETGSGKSTQLVQFLLDDLYAKGDYKTQIFCTQPRRISAIGLSERVAEERATTCGEEVGYIIRGANKSSRNTRIKFLTTGILVKFLQNGDEFLNDAVLVLDEVHERSMETDLIIILLKKLLSRYKNLKVVMMSATVDLSVFQNFFKGLTTCHIKGRTFPIEDFYLDHVLEKTNFQIEMNDEWISPKADSKFFQTGNINYDLIVSLVSKIHDDLKNESNDGSILIFLPGVAEINKCVRLLTQNFSSPSVVLPLHSALTPQEQHKVFETFPGKRKIVVSTNIAETSITINDCVVTIDSGRVKSMTYNSVDNTTKLIETFESKAEAKQRRGRAGRVSKGKSYKLFTEETYESMLNNPIPEIKRINLDSLYLVVKSMGIKDVIAFLDTGMDPPPLNSLVKSEELLKCAGLIDEYDDLTELGSFISLLPIIDPKHGKLLIFSIIFGCADIGILTASVLSVGSPFIRSADSRDDIKNILSKTKHLGDLLSTVLIVEEYFKIKTPSEKRKFMNQNHLSFTKINEISSAKTQYLSILQDIGFLPLKYKEGDQRLNKNYKNNNLIKSIITGAFYPQVARAQLPDPKFFNTSSGAIQKDPEAAQTKYWIRNEEFITSLNKEDSNEAATEELPATRAFIHPSSVMFDTTSGRSTPQNIVPSDYKTDREDGLIDFGVLQQRQVDFTPSLKSAKSKAIKSPFVVFKSSTLTSKLFLRDVTPTSTLSTLLFGGPLSYDLNSVSSGRTSPGIVLDSWLPIKTWCKNAVLVKELRLLLDQVIKSKLESPEYSSSKPSSQNDEVLDLVNLILNIDR